MANGATLRIIEGLDGDANPNNDSVAALLTFGQVRVLFTGDSEEAAEAVLAGKVGDVDVFKAAHHGSRTANTMARLVTSGGWAHTAAHRRFPRATRCCSAATPSR